MGQTRGAIPQQGKWANNAHEPIVKMGTHRVGGHQTHCTAIATVAASRRLTFIVRFNCSEQPKGTSTPNAISERCKRSEKERDKRSLHRVLGPCSQARPFLLAEPTRDTPKLRHGTSSPRGPKKQISFFNINFLAPTQNTPFWGPQNKVDVPHFLGEETKKGPT